MLARKKPRRRWANGRIDGTRPGAKKLKRGQRGVHTCARLIAEQGRARKSKEKFNKEQSKASQLVGSPRGGATPEPDDSRPPMGILPTLRPSFLLRGPWLCVARPCCPRFSSIWSVLQPGLLQHLVCSLAWPDPPSKKPKNAPKRTLPPVSFPAPRRWWRPPGERGGDGRETTLRPTPRGRRVFVYLAVVMGAKERKRAHSHQGRT